jgi:putative transposase
MEFKTASHAAYRLYYHLVLVTKYRKKCLSLEVYQTLEDIIRTLCKTWGCTLLELSGEEDHVHILFEGKPSMDISHFVNNIKTISSRLIRKQHGEHLAKWYWRTGPEGAALSKTKPVLWSASYAIVTAGGAPLEVIKQYIINQEKPTK